MKRMPLVRALLAIAAVFAVLAAAPSALACGIERWPEKTLQDRRAELVNFTPKPIGVQALRRKRVRRDPEGFRRAPVETTVYRVRARLIGVRAEDDGDVHLVISSLTNRRRTMIVEIPSADCIARASRTARRKMRAARRSFERVCGPPSDTFQTLRGTATIDGVGFFDFIHGQTGIAPNGIELHPVTRFRATSC
jgi:hypothetical protein